MEEKTRKQFFREYQRLMHDFDFLEFESSKDEDMVDEYFNKLKEWGCRAFGGHEWLFDMCGHWEHQYCAACFVAKYPGLKIHEDRDVTEEEYLKSLGN
jgi:hypothetical protein